MLRLLPALLLLLFLPGLAISGDSPSLRAALQDALAAPAVEGFELTYNDVHPLYGGTRFELSGGTLTRTDVPRSAQPPVVRRAEAGPDVQRRLLILLTSIAAWEQREPERPPVPDESRTHLIVKLASAEADVWEWSNDLAKNDRLIQVRHALEGLVPAGAP